MKWSNESIVMDITGTRYHVRIVARLLIIFNGKHFFSIMWLLVIFKNKDTKT